MIRFALNLLARGRLSVFLFHQVPEVADPLTPQTLPLSEFERQIDFIREHFNVMPLEDAVRAMQQDALPPRAACITFDDGYPDWLLRAVPLLESRNLHATFFVTTGQFDQSPMWHERITNAIRSASLDELSLDEFGLAPMPLTDIEARRRAIACIEHHLKYQTVACRDEAIDVLERITGADATRLTPMDRDDVRKIHSRGFGIGAHTITHPILNLCNRSTAMHEIGGVKDTLEEMIGGSVRAFAYPNGIPVSDFSGMHVGMVKQAGYTHAVTTHWGAARCGDSVFQIPRFTPWGPDTLRMQVQLLRNLMITATSLPEA